MSKKTKCICKECGIEFEMYTCWIKKNRNGGSYCSKECLSKSKIGIQPITYNRIELICTICANTYTVKNYRKETSKTCSRKCLAVFRGRLMQGENHPNWKGGITSNEEKIRHSQEYILWRNEVYKKDGYICQKCGDDKGGNLHAHHILNFSEYSDLRFNINNGITLCEKCHSPSIIGSFHYIYKTRNNTQAQLEEYLNETAN